MGDSTAHPSSRPYRAVQAALLSWPAVFVTVSVLVLVGSEHTVLSAYRNASIDWFAGRDIYGTNGQGFLYFPSAAILFAPCAYLPVSLGEIIWRLLMIGSFAFGVWRLSSVVGRPAVTFPIMTAAALLPALACARNGQSTLVMTAMMMLAAADLASDRRGRAAVWLSIGLAFKPLIIVMIALAGALDRRMLPRLLAGILLVALFPFLTQSPHYVAGQYAKCVVMLRTASHCGVTELWAQPFSVPSLFGFDVPERLQTMIRALAAAGTLVLCWIAQQKFAERATRKGSLGRFEFLFAFSVLYILLFSPRTENNTYAMLGPVMGLLAVRAVRPNWRGADLLLLAGLTVGLVLGDGVVRLFLSQGHPIWVKPLIGIVVLGYACNRLIRDESSSETWAGKVRREDEAAIALTGGGR